MNCSYRPHFIPYSLPKDITFCTSKLGNWCHLSLWGECPKFWNLCFQSVISFERFFLEGSINEHYLKKPKKKKSFKIWVHSGPVFSFLAKFLHFSTKNWEFFWNFFFSSVN
jgi:hypothetical protein